MPKLRDARKAKGVTAKAVANHLGVTQRTYYNYEQNQNAISIEKALDICDFLGYTLTDIFLPESDN